MKERASNLKPFLPRLLPVVVVAVLTNTVAIASDLAPLPDGFSAPSRDTVKGIYIKASHHDTFNQTGPRKSDLQRFFELRNRCNRAGHKISSTVDQRSLSTTTYWFYRTEGQQALYALSYMLDLDEENCSVEILPKGSVSRWIYVGGVTYRIAADNQHGNNHEARMWREREESGNREEKKLGKMVWPTMFSFSPVECPKETLRRSKLRRTPGGFCGPKRVNEIPAICKTSGMPYIFDWTCSSERRDRLYGLIVQGSFGLDDGQSRGFEILEMNPKAKIDRRIFDFAVTWPD